MLIVLSLLVQQDSLFYGCMLGPLLWKILVENGLIRQMNGINM